MQIIRPVLAVFFFFSLFFFSACANRPEIPVQKSSNQTEATSAETEMGKQNSSAPSKVQASRSGVSFEASETLWVLEFSRPEFAFKLPSSDWGLVSDPADESAPLEFFQAKTGRRAEIQTILLGNGESSNVMDRARAEMQGRSLSYKKTQYAAVKPLEKWGITGAFFETAGNSAEANLAADGFVFASGNRVFFLTLSASDSVPARENFIREWNAFFAEFQIAESLKKAADKEEISPEAVTDYESKALGYRFHVNDTLWHFWSGIAAQNGDPDLVLANRAEESAFFVYGTIVDPNEVSALDLQKVLLIRLGLDPNDPNLETERVRGGNAEKFTLNFTCTRVIDGYDFRYVGRYFWENGRGILVASWAQGVLYKKYAKAMQQAIDGITLFEKPTTLSDEKSLRFQAAVVNQVGLLRLAENQPLVALSYFEKANKMDPTEPLYLINCGFVYQLKELYGPGVNHFQSEMDLVRKSGRLLSILGEMYEAMMDYGEARKYAEMALRYTPNNPEYVINLSDALWGLGQRTQSLAVVQNLYDKQPSSRLGVYLAKTYMGMDLYAEAVEVLYATKKRFGMSIDLGLTLMDALIFLGRYSEALAVSEEVLPLGTSDYRVWTLRGKVQFYSKNYAQAEKSLSHALLMHPEDEDIKSFLSATKAFLGKADNRTLQKKIEPVEMRPVALAALVNREYSTKAKEDGFPAVVHYSREALRADKDKAWVRTKQQLIEILDTRGVGLYAELAFNFLPGYDRIYLNALEVYDSTMKLKAKMNLNGAYITYATELGLDNEMQTAHFPLEKLSPGDFIFVQISRTSIANYGVIPFVSFEASEEIPVQQTSFKIYADTSRFVTEEYGPLSTHYDADGEEWKIEDPIVIRHEPFMPVYRDYGAGFELTGKRTWQDVGREYENLIRHQFKNAIPVREKAFEVRGSRLGLEAILAEVRYVRENIRYRDVRFGGHSLIPQISETTLRERRGDCKDQSLLLKEMLAAIGVPSKLVAIHLSDPGFETLPSIQQFNHMMLYIPKGEKYPEMWVDPSDKGGNNRPVPLDMEGKVALVIDGDSSHVAVTPVLEDEKEHQVFLGHRLHLSADGSAEFRDSLSLKGKFASVLRNQLYGKDAKEMEVLIQDLIAQRIPDVSISRVRAENVTDFDKPLKLVITFASKNYFGKSSAGIRGRYPNVWERAIMHLPKVRTRYLPIRMPHETEFESELVVTADGNVQVKEAPALNHETEYVNFEKTAHGYKWTTFAIYADPSEYERIREEWNYLLDATSPEIIRN
ncbi:transglutaminase-like putative cysteine protease [Hallerella porci]|uniref:Transglutaminase-like putative cysteine protease n=2 Tax=Fibrobacteraceae TaxID=204431 RepID=A0ABX5LLX1_9BACT|nr:transglutaminase-like putative cysteine protease [Hallerella porci]